MAKSNTDIQSTYHSLSDLIDASDIQKILPTQLPVQHGLPIHKVYTLNNSTSRATDNESLPDFTVVTVCRNADKYLRRALDSVLALDYQGEFNLRIQDSLSTDETAVIVEDMGLMNSFYSQQDKSALDGLLIAAQNARSEFIAVCWADDELLPNALEWAAHHFKKTQADIIYGDQTVVNTIDNTCSYNAGRPWNLHEFYIGEFYPPFSSSFFRRETLAKAANYLSEYDNDEYEFWCVLAQLGTIVYRPGLVSNFYVHSDSVWVNNDAHINKMVRGKIAAIERLANNNLLTHDQLKHMDAAITGMYLWGVMHLLYHGSSTQGLVDMIDVAMKRYNGDYRYIQIRDHLEGLIP